MTFEGQAQLEEASVGSPLEAGEMSPTAPLRHQRASGTVRISFRHRAGATRLHRLFQEGAAKVRLPRLGGAIPEAVLINTAGGLTGGDRFANEIVLETGSRAVLTTQACERIYRSLGGPAEIVTRATLEAGAALDWLPQETILFDGGRVTRRFEVAMAADAALLAVEAVIFGRTARGEIVRTGSFRDRWRIFRGGKLLFADDLRLEGPIAELLARPAVLNGNAAMATVLLAAPECENKLEAVRAAIGDAAGASAWNGKLLVRLAAQDGFALRQKLLPALMVLTAGRSLPKVWQL